MVCKCWYRVWGGGSKVLSLFERSGVAGMIWEGQGPADTRMSTRVGEANVVFGASIILACGAVELAPGVLSNTLGIGTAT